MESYHSDLEEELMEMTISFQRYAMRLGVVALCSASLCVAPTLAQITSGSGTQQQTQLDALTKVVGLTPDQATQVKAINDDTTKKMMDLRNSGENPSTARPKIVAIRTDRQAKIRALLTNDQKPQFDAYIASQPHGQRPNGKPRKAVTTPPPQK